MNQTPDENHRSDDVGMGATRRLSTHDAMAMTDELAHLTRAGLPLVQGLRAAANEARGLKLARHMRRAAAQIERGDRLEDVLGSERSALPPHFKRIFTAAIQSGSLGSVLSEMMEHQRRTSDLWRTLRFVVSYPLVLLVFTLGLVTLLFAYVVPQFSRIYENFGIQIPASTTTLIWISEDGLQLLLRCVASLAIAAVLLRLVIGRARFRRIIWYMPIFGLLFQWTGTAEFTRLLSVLLAQGIALPDAMRLSADGVKDAHVALVAKELAIKTDAGQVLSEALVEDLQLPATMIPIVRWGETLNELPEAMRAASEMFEGRVQLRCSWLESIFPALMFILIGGFVLFSILPGLFLPLLDLITNLSS